MIIAQHHPTIMVVCIKVDEYPVSVLVVCQWLCKIAESCEASDEAGMVSLLNFKLRMKAQKDSKQLSSVRKASAILWERRLVEQSPQLRFDLILLC